MIRRGTARGFSLIEALVSVVIAATVLTQFYSAIATGARLEDRADRQAAQVLVATIVLDRVGVDVPLRAGVNDNGRLRGHDWSLSIGMVPPADMQLGPIQPNELIFISVTVTSPNDGSPVTLRAIRYAEQSL